MDWKAALKTTMLNCSRLNVTSWVAFKVFLFPDLICHLNEAAQFLTQILRLLQSKVMDVIVSRDRVDAHKALSFVPVRQDQVTNDFPALDLERGKGHAHLEGDAAFLRQDSHWSATPNLGDEQLIEPANRCGFASKV